METKETLGSSSTHPFEVIESVLYEDGSTLTLKHIFYSSLSEARSFIDSERTFYQQELKGDQYREEALTVRIKMYTHTRSIPSLDSSWDISSLCSNVVQTGWDIHFHSHFR